MVKLLLLFSHILLILDFKLLDLHLECLILSVKWVNSLLLLFNLARKHMLTHLELGFDICHSCMQVTLLSGRLRSHRLGDDWYLTTRNGIFKVGNSRVKPREAHPLKSVFCGLINLTLNAVVYNCIFNGWLIELPDSLFAYLTQVSQWIKGLVGGS